MDFENRLGNDNKLYIKDTQYTPNLHKD